MRRPKTGRSKRGGKRPGAGRPKTLRTASNTLSAIDLKSLLTAPAPDEIETVAQRHAHKALASMVKLLMFGSVESAKITAAIEVLDRGYGKPAVEIGGDAMLPFMKAPATPTTSTEIRTEARKFANLAIAVLEKIAESGASENSRASASKMLLARGLGTVAAARMPDEFDKRPLGKKEQALHAAANAATGMYATPAPPRRDDDHANS
jgi:hypothetical protein